MMKQFSVTDLVGNYAIIGSNQDDTDTTYKGILTLTLDINNQIIAKWVINRTQEQFGIGFFKDNILAINFNYKGEDLNTYKGTVIYRCISNDILDGFWSEEYGNPNYLGIERCYRIKKETTLLN